MMDGHMSHMLLQDPWYWHVLARLFSWARLREGALVTPFRLQMLQIVCFSWALFVAVTLGHSPQSL